MRCPNLENHDSWSLLSEWSIGYKWKCTGSVCQLIAPAQVNQRVQKGSSESGFWIEGIYSPDCCVLLPDPCFQLCLTFNFIFFIIGSTDMEILGPMEKQSLEGQRHQWPADDDRTGIHWPGRTIWTAMVQAPGKFFWWVLRKYCHQLMLLPDSQKRNHTDIRTFTAQRLRGSSVSRCWWRHSEGEENKYFWILAICTAWDLQGLSSHKSGSASFKWRSNLSISYSSPVFWLYMALAVDYNFLKTVAGLIQYCGGCDMENKCKFYWQYLNLSRVLMLIRYL